LKSVYSGIVVEVILRDQEYAYCEFTVKYLHVYYYIKNNCNKAYDIYMNKTRINSDMIKTIAIECGINFRCRQTLNLPDNVETLVAKW